MTRQIRDKYRKPRKKDVIPYSFRIKIAPWQRNDGLLDFIREKIADRKDKSMATYWPRRVPITNKVLISLIKKHGDNCFYCRNPHPTTIDHLKPKSKGGKDNKENLRPCCFKCNGEKGSLSIEEFNLIRQG